MALIKSPNHASIRMSTHKITPDLNKSAELVAVNQGSLQIHKGESYKNREPLKQHFNHNLTIERLS